MRLSMKKVIVPVVVALIGFAGVIASALITKNPKSDSEVKSVVISHTTTSLECSPNVASKVCIANLTVQINSDEPLQVNNHQRIPLKAGDNLKILNLNYCVPNAVSLNKLEAKAFLFKNGVESYQNFISTPSQFPINAGVCHKVGNFAQSWKVEAGMHQAMIPIIKYDGSNKVVDKSFYFTLDVGQ
ncbi:hypothetical protein HCG51_23015 [Tolypothrix sp. PCC 7910]|uniref:hypothetical protein n=1 Tax=Tolypothrix sp. PCC 7910 TaxID=2099387 RepID=UPI0014278D4C|nr:hypothetical protein [Tolypothrix sp. PCC 7910]QIR39299.1 hypothetical protein HCG51_23015 [Tolypothrix sp. PCC 7910]